MVKYYGGVYRVTRKRESLPKHRTCNVHTLRVLVPILDLKATILVAGSTRMPPLFPCLLRAVARNGKTCTAIDLDPDLVLPIPLQNDSAPVSVLRPIVSSCHTGTTGTRTGT